MFIRILPAVVFASAIAVAQNDNVLVIIADDLGVEMLNCYGPAPNQPDTTNITTELAQQGVRFTNAQACPNCSPTRSSLLTGRYQQRHMVGSYVSKNDQRVIGLDPSEVTFPELLSASYDHALFGKWHVTRQSGSDPSTWDDPLEVGGFAHHSGDFTSPQSYFSWYPLIDGGLSQTPSTVYKTWQETQNAINWINAQNNPWVCVVAYHTPHAPFHMPPDHNGSSPPAGGGGGGSSDRDCYEAMIEYMDKEIGRLLTHVDAATTNVIFLSDNGTPRQVASPGGVPTWRAKGTPYEGGVKVPLIVRGPVVANADSTESALVHVVDLFATILELTGSPAHTGPEIDSVSFVPQLGGQLPAEPRQFAYSALFEGYTWPAPLQTMASTRVSTGMIGVGDTRYWNHFCIRDDRYKLMRIAKTTDDGFDTKVKFYDLATDPGETTPIFSVADSGDIFSTPPVPALTFEQEQRYDALVAELIRIHPVPGIATLATFGHQKCRAPMVPNASPMTIVAGGLPVANESFEVSVVNAPANALTLLAISDQTIAERLLPGCSECYRYIPGTAGQGVFTTATGTATIPIAVPASAMGLTFYMQWRTLNFACSQWLQGDVSSDALAATVGLAPMVTVPPN